MRATYSETTAAFGTWRSTNVGKVIPELVDALDSFRKYKNHKTLYLDLITYFQQYRESVYGKGTGYESIPYPCYFAAYFLRKHADNFQIPKLPAWRCKGTAGSSLAAFKSEVIKYISTGDTSVLRESRWVKDTTFLEKYKESQMNPKPANLLPERTDKHDDIQVALNGAYKVKHFEPLGEPPMNTEQMNKYKDNAVTRPVLIFGRPSEDMKEEDYLRYLASMRDELKHLEELNETTNSAHLAFRVAKLKSDIQDIVGIMDLNLLEEVKAD